MKDFQRRAVTLSRYPQKLTFRGRVVRGVYFRPESFRYSNDYLNNTFAEVAVEGRDYFTVPQAFCLKMSVDKLRMIGTCYSLEAAVRLHDAVTYHFWAAFKTRPHLGSFYEYAPQADPTVGAPEPPENMEALADRIFKARPIPKALTLGEWAAENPGEYRKVFLLHSKWMELLNAHPPISLDERCRAFDSYLQSPEIQSIPLP